MIVDEHEKPVGTVEDGDAVVLFNFRADRMVEMSKAFEYPDFDIFDRERFPKASAAGQRSRAAQGARGSAGGGGMRACMRSCMHAGSSAPCLAPASRLNAALPLSPPLSPFSLSLSPPSPQSPTTRRTSSLWA